MVCVHGFSCTLNGLFVGVSQRVAHFCDLCMCDSSQHAAQFVTDHHSLSCFLLSLRDVKMFCGAACRQVVQSTSHLMAHGIVLVGSISYVLLVGTGLVTKKLSETCWMHFSDVRFFWSFCDLLRMTRLSNWKEFSVTCFMICSHSLYLLSLTFQDTKNFWNKTETVTDYKWQWELP